MAKFVTDNAFEIELNKLLLFAEDLKRAQAALSNTYKQLPQKEKVLAIKKIEDGHKQISKFIEKIRQEEIFNSGIKFKIETLKNKYSVLVVLWKKLSGLL